MRASLVLTAVLFFVAVGLSAAAALRLVGQGSTSKKASIIWCIAIACAWSAWFVAVSQ